MDAWREDHLYLLTQTTGVAALSGCETCTGKTGKTSTPDSVIVT